MDATFRAFAVVQVVPSWSGHHSLPRDQGPIGPVRVRGNCQQQRRRRDRLGSKLRGRGVWHVGKAIQQCIPALSVHNAPRVQVLSKMPDSCRDRYCKFCRGAWSLSAIEAWSLSALTSHRCSSSNICSVNPVQCAPYFPTCWKEIGLDVVHNQGLSFERHTALRRGSTFGPRRKTNAIFLVMYVPPKPIYYSLNCPWRYRVHIRLPSQGLLGTYLYVPVEVSEDYPGEKHTKPRNVKVCLPITVLASLYWVGGCMGKCIPPELFRCSILGHNC